MLNFVVGFGSAVAIIAAIAASPLCQTYASREVWSEHMEEKTIGRVFQSTWTGNRFGFTLWRTVDFRTPH